jgi:plasmid maintenance system killer protein
MQEIDIIFMPSFLREARKLSEALQDEVTEKIILFRDRGNHERLRVHKLTGILKNKYSFSVNYAHRIVFLWEDKNTAVFLAIGDHDVYR